MSVVLGVLDDGQVGQVDGWLRAVLWDNELPYDSDTHDAPFEVHRLKGRLALAGGAEKVIQGVRELFEIFSPPPGGGGGGGGSGEREASGASKIVLIGRHLEDFDFGRSLRRAVESAQ